MEKAIGTILVVFVIGLLVGGVGGYYVMQNQATTAFNQGMTYQQSLQTQAAVTTAPDLTCTWDNDTFDFATAVDADGNVATTTAETNTLTITNNGDTDASNVWISLYNPVKNKYGLDKDLQSDYTKIQIAVGSLSKITLYKESVFSSGYEIVTIPAGSDIDVTVTFTMLKNTHGDYPDDTSIDNAVYVYGAGAPSVETCDFTVLT